MREECTFLICSSAHGAHLDYCLSLQGKMETSIMDKVQLKNQPHHILLAFDLIALNSNGILTIILF